MAKEKLHFSPCNLLLEEAREMCSDLHGIPSYASFPRWWNNGSLMWLESSSGSRLLTIDFMEEKVVVPPWVTRETQRDEIEWPEHWTELWHGSLFLPDGSAKNSDLFAAASDADREMFAARRAVR